MIDDGIDKGLFKRKILLNENLDLISEIKGFSYIHIQSK